jgi:predicted small secreted protein
MKKSILLFMFLLVTSLSFTSCREDKSTGEKIEDGIEEVGDGIEEGAEEVEDEIDDATDDN